VNAELLRRDEEVERDDEKDGVKLKFATKSDAEVEVEVVVEVVTDHQLVREIQYRSASST